MIIKKPIQKEEKEQIALHLNRFSGRILHAHAAYSLWWAIKMNLNPNEVKEEKAQENVRILNYYKPIFPTILRALESTFIIELYKFFDKTKGVLKLVEVNNGTSGIAKSSISEECKMRIREILKEDKDIIGRIEKLRHELFAHDSLSKDNQYYMPSTNNIDKIFVDIRQIQNLISKDTTGAYHAWTDEEGDEMKFYFKELIINLEKGKVQRLKEHDEEMKRKYSEEQK